MAAGRVTAQATATAATRPRPDRRDTEPQHLRRPGISPLGELPMQWMSFRRRRPRRRPPCPCRQPWTSSWQDRPIGPPIPPAKFLTLPNRISNPSAARRRIVSKFLPGWRAPSSVRPMPWVRKKSTFELDPLGIPWNGPAPTDGPESTTGLGAGGAFFRGALNWRLPRPFPADLHLCALALVRARRHRPGCALCTDYLAPAPLRKSDGDMPASLRNDLLKALSEPKPESMATRSTLASWCISRAWA